MPLIKLAFGLHVFNSWTGETFCRTLSLLWDATEPVWCAIAYTAHRMHNIDRWKPLAFSIYTEILDRTVLRLTTPRLHLVLHLVKRLVVPPTSRCVHSAVACHSGGGWHYSHPLSHSHSLTPLTHGSWRLLLKGGWLFYGLSFHSPIVFWHSFLL